MKLIEFNPSSVPSRGPAEASLSVAQSGRITINKLAAEKLQITSEHSMKLFLDQETDSWYLSVSLAKDGFPIKTDSKGYQFIQCGAIAKRMNVYGKTIHYLIGKAFDNHGIQIYPLLKP